MSAIPPQPGDELTATGLESLLGWLGPDRTAAGEKYESIRKRLIKMFVCRGAAAPEDLADLTINRVIRKLPDILPGWQGDPAHYFLSVSRHIWLESIRAEHRFPTFLQHQSEPEVERDAECLRSCMNTLSPEERALVLDYYQEEKQAKIDHRAAMAERLGIGVNALRIRACRIRSKLQACMVECRDRHEAG